MAIPQRQPAPADYDELAYARDVLTAEAEAIERLAMSVGEPLLAAASLLAQCRGHAVVVGMGKAGLIGRKLAATFSSTGTPAYFLHPAEAIHGDLGQVRRVDTPIVLSNSGETAEITRILPSLGSLAGRSIAICARATSSLGEWADICLPIGAHDEACRLGLAPTTSTTAMLALGDALALLVSRRRGFQAEDFARFHPGGSLGRRLAHVDEYMRPLAECRVAPATETVRQVFVSAGRPGRRSGAVMLTDSQGVLCGILTDSDLARLLEARRDQALDRPAADVMTVDPQTIAHGARLREALHLLSQQKISELPVVDALGRPVGMIDITDTVGLLPWKDVVPAHRSATIPFPSPNPAPGPAGHEKRTGGGD